jgi:hypothetical protein
MRDMHPPLDPAQDVSVNGKYIGSDLDPFICSMLAREYGLD